MGVSSRRSTWLFGPAADVAVFGGSAAFALALVLLRRALGLEASLPAWGYVVFILGVDVAHVYATLFRTYFDADEIRRHPARYYGIPLAAHAAGACIHWASAALFWSALAYLAVFHFVRQQAGWLALYRSRAGDRSWQSRCVDGAAIYAATGYPLVYWHAHLASRHFVWFTRGDFADVSRFAEQIVPPAHAAWVSALTLFVATEALRVVRGRSPSYGKSIVVAATASTWYVGIVATNSDFDFTVTNVVTHGVPYVALLFVYARARAREGTESLATAVARAGFFGFFAVIFVAAFVEEAAWDRFVWHDRPWLFGGAPAHLGQTALALVVPLLAVPQITHYVLDGLLWRRGEAGRAALERAPHPDTRRSRSWAPVPARFGG